MFLPIMAVWIFLAVADVSCQHNVKPNCCDKGTDEVEGEILECAEQKPGPACGKNFYVVKVKGDKCFCINPDSKWFDDEIKKKNLNCKPGLSYQHFVKPNCCDTGSDEVNGEILECFEQNPGPVCDNHFFIVTVSGGTKFCINPNSQWLKDKTEKGGITCHPTDGHHQQKLDVAAKPRKKH